MPLDKKIANDAVLDGFIQFQSWAREFVLQWNEPQIKLEMAKQKDQAITAWEMMPPEMKAELERQFPEQYAQAEQTYRKLKGEYDASSK